MSNINRLSNILEGLYSNDMQTHRHAMRAIPRLLGFETNKTGHLEKWISGAGGLVGILAVTYISHQFLSVQGAAWVVASMGATAVLLFAVPHGPLSQPWPVLAGHFVSALIGVVCARWIPDVLVASAVAVAVAIISMHYLRCIHPPGGATALSAVIGGANIQALGFQYVFTPVLLNAVIMVIIAVIFNYAFRWRRYPTALAAGTDHVVARQIEGETFSESDLEKALQAMNSTIDISGQDLMQIYRLAQQTKTHAGLSPDQLKVGQYYSNGLYGSAWQVRQIIDMAMPKTSANDLLIYKIVAGSNRRKTGTQTLDSFTQWASYEVYLNENSWQRKEYNDTVLAS